MGTRGKEFVRENFLLPRGVHDHLAVADQLVNGKLTARESVICYHPRVLSSEAANNLTDL